MAWHQGGSMEVALDSVSEHWSLSLTRRALWPKVGHRMETDPGSTSDPPSHDSGWQSYYH